MVGMALMGLVAIGLGGAVFLQAHAPGDLRAATPGAEPRVAFAGNNASLAGLFTQSTAMGAQVCSGVSWELTISPKPVKPATAFTMSIFATEVGTGTALRVNSASYYYKLATVRAYRLWQANPVTNAKPAADSFALNTALPPDAVAPLPAAPGTSETAGYYPVLVEATCLMPDGTTLVTCAVPPLEYPEYLQVFDTPSATFEAKDYTTPGQPLVAAGDWVPLFGFNMKYPDGNPAQRALTKLRFGLTAPPGGTSPPTEDMFRDFALFKFSGPLPANTGEVQAKLYLNEADPASIAISNRMIHDSWDAHGWPYEMPVDAAAAPPNYVNGPNGLVYHINDEQYGLNFCLDTTDPDFPLNELGNPFGFGDTGPKRGEPDINPERDWVTATAGDGYTYVLCVRLSPTWASQTNLAVNLYGALMQPYYFDGPQNRYRIFAAPFADGKPVDTYTPDFFSGDTIAPKPGDGYTSVFDVFDPRGGAGAHNNLNQWNHPVTMYTPVPGFARPRWDLASQTVQFVGGELMDMRQLFSVESWVNVLGINADGYSWDQPMELNLVFTDIGADPFAPPGNGGFDPRDGLDTFTLKSQGGPHTAVGEDYAFNGVWLWYDNNADGIFDPPTPNGTTGVTFNDHPMVPMYMGNPSEVHVVNPGNHQWDYEPFPPGGGDPWWKIRITLGTVDTSIGWTTSGRRRVDNQDSPLGYMVHPVPKDPVVADYFVTMRADSGYADVNGTLPGDGVGINLGADMRVFIEPRRWNPRNGGHWDGGMLFRSQAISLQKYYLGTPEPERAALFPDGTPVMGESGEQPSSSGLWQSFDVWQVSSTCDCGCIPCPTNQYTAFPWWTERTHNQDTVKPLRCGTEVHDLVLTYSTDNRYGKITPIMAGQNMYRFFGGYVQDRPIYGHTDPNSPRSAMSIWTDPAFIDYSLIAGGPPLTPEISDPQFLLEDLVDYFGINELNSQARYNAGVGSDLSWLPASYDSLTDIQYAFETVPFQLAGDAIDAQLRDPRSTYFPNPPWQPTLPRYSTWSGYQSGQAVIAWGEASQCYLASEGALPNGEYMQPGGNGDAEANYADDDYVFVVSDTRFQSTAFPGDLSGKWLVDSLGGRYYILSNSGTTLHLRKGHGAYLAPPASVPVYPYQVPVGPGSAVDRGRWQIVEDSLPRGFYPRIEDWAPENLLDTGKAWAARLLKQYIAPDSEPIAMLGINVAGTDDPMVNASSPIGLNSVTVAFWGPEFEPSQLAGLDAKGELYTSGVLLYENSASSGFPGVFDGPIFSDLSPTPFFRDRIVPLESGTLLWTEKPEPIDLDADYKADDLSGDEVIFLGDPLNAEDVAKLSAADRAKWDGLSDLAWVLELRPRAKWLVPYRDARVDGASRSKDAEGKVFGTNWPSFWTKTPTLLDLEDLASGAEKGLDPTAGNPGDDLFVVVRTSKEAKAFSEFRAMIPAKLPTRTPASRQEAAIQMSPRSYNVVDTVTKPSPEEGAVQDFYGHDMLPASVYTRVTDLTPALIVPPATIPVIQPGGLEAAILGVDSSVNRPANIAAKGAGVGAQSGAASFTVVDTDVTAPTDSIYYRMGQGWTAETVGLYLIGYGTGELSSARIEGYEITAVSGRQLTLRAGAPRADKPWFVIKDPSFLEQVVVEFYDFNQSGNFDLQNDLLPLNHEDPFNSQYSGVALYRDNDAHAQNRNGVFDPPIRSASGAVTEYIDLPVRLDAPPILLGTVGGEPEYQVKFVFSTPGTDDLVGRDATPYATQARNRQWVPQTTGLTTGDADFGPDFFVVVRPSNQMALNDRFQAAIVSWGPNTPTEPDPDNFSVSLTPGQLPGQHEDEFDTFSEFPWGSRAVGYITLFQNPQPVYYWGFDKLKGRTAPRKDVDRSQDVSQDGAGSARALRNWVRTNPALATRSLPVTSLAPPQLDFVGVPTRQRINADVAFTLLGVTQVSSVAWDFGDGLTSTEVNPVHQYAATGRYTVQVAVVNQFGIRNTARKVEYIEIIDAPFADFTADPVSGTITPGLPLPALAVTFTDSSIGGDSCAAIGWSWNFGDGATSTEQNPVHRYTAPGIYTVTLETTFQCSDGTVVRQRKRDNYVTVLPCVGCNTGEGEGEPPADPPAADIKFNTLVKDKEAIVPLSDWVQFFRFTMSYGPDPENYAPRILQSMRYYVTYDNRLPGATGYMNQGAPYPTDLLEFAVFKESKGCEDCNFVWGPVNGVLDPAYDTLLFSWDNLGAPAGKITGVGEGAGIVYTMDFIGNGTALNPQFPLVAAPTSDDYPDGNSYIVAVRSSATWRSQLTMGVQVLEAKMINPNTGGFPVDKDGKPIDSYSPNFYDGKILEDKQFYSSSFTAYDFTGSIYSGQTNVTYTANAWNYPHMLYMPLGEFSRPRWNAVGQVLQVVAGEFLQERTLTAIDDWKQVIGINAHSTRAVHFEHGNWDERGPQLREVNVILTDIGADPYGPAGNGGFNPRDGLKPLTTDTWGTPIVDAEAYAKDVTYNGIWVWYDANNNGVFDAPTMNAGGGVTFNGDFPMLPSDMELAGEPVPSWEYIPVPPGGGDPWWKISLRLIDGDRKVSNVLSNAVYMEGWLEPVPDNHGSFTIDSEWSPDFFVVVRTDSGFKDASLASGDGGGIAMGADFRAFIEPRRVDPGKGTTTGGIFLDSMIPAQGLPGMGASLSPWQNDPRWLEHEPWWPQRTMNQNSAKPLKVGVEVHDLVMTYESQSNYRKQTDLFYTPAINLNDLGQIDYTTLTIGGYSPIGGGPLSGFDHWLDPFGLEQAKFQNGHTVDVQVWRIRGQATIGFGALSTTVLFNDMYSYGQYAYETVPFFNQDPDNGDAPPAGPRSSAYPNPPAQPTLPEYATWSAQLKPGEYPRASQWTPENLKARILGQHTEANSYHTAMLGINLIGSADPVVNSAGGPMTVSQVCVAFWGPDFTPAALKPINPDNNDNQSLVSGVLLWEDADLNGIFLNTQELAGYQEGAGILPLLDRIVPVTNLAWSSVPELVDINGDGKPDDMSGDGIVDDSDRAWVLTFYPKANWTVPQKDGSVFNVGTGKSTDGTEARKKNTEHLVEVNGTMNGTDPAAKALDPTVLQPGDDLFITVSTSDSVHRFQQFRAVVPATLPTRSETLRRAGIQFYPQVNTSSTAFVKGSPEEDPVQDFFGWDMLESNVPLRLVDMTNRHANIDIGGGAIPGVGIDAATNQPDGTLASGDGGIGLASGFRVPGAVWTADQYKGDWLVDAGYESYEITGNVGDEMTLLSGTPRNGKWRIAHDPSFLEEVQVELYGDQSGGSFNPLTDLLPLDIDPRISGVALYRDNDNHPDNRNGIFDPDIDVPIALDAPPRFSGQTAEDIQVKFVFSTPGTDEFPLPKAAQTRHRQWVQDGFGAAISDSDYGPDFFVVVRAAQGMQVADKFRVGIVSWGPNTPTEPDPDTWANLPGEDRNDYVKFREFPWGDRGVGFVSFFKDPQKRYFMDGPLARVRDDNSGFNWVRSHSSKKRRTGIIEARVRPVGPTSLVITDASERQLPSQTLPGETFPLIIYGSHFGAGPVVVMSGYDVVVNSVSGDAISISISTKPGIVPQEPVVLLVRNPVTGEEVSRADLFTVVTGSAMRRPKIFSVDPAKGSRDVFPARLLGENFGKRENMQVKFGQTFMPVLDVAADGTSITVGFPAGGMPNPGKMDVTVRDASKNMDDVLLEGFEYQNGAVKKKFFGLFACSGGGGGAAAGWTDLTVLIAAAGALFAARRRGAARAR
jgi:PKD repeat protein